MKTLRHGDLETGRGRRGGVKYGVQFMGQRRVRRDWGQTVVMALMWLALAMLCGWLWSLVSSSKFQVSSFKTAGIVSDWVAFGVVGTMCLCVLALLSWRAFCEVMQPAGDDLDVLEVEREARFVGEWTALDAVHDFLATKGIMSVSDTEMEVLVELAAGGSLVALDKHVRAQWKKRLFVTSLMELMALCARVKREEVVS